MTASHWQYSVSLIKLIYERLSSTCHRMSSRDTLNKHSLIAQHMSHTHILHVTHLPFTFHPFPPTPFVRRFFTWAPPPAGLLAAGPPYLIAGGGPHPPQVTLRQWCRLCACQIGGVSERRRGLPAPVRCHRHPPLRLVTHGWSAAAAVSIPYLTLSMPTRVYACCHKCSKASLEYCDAYADTLSLKLKMLAQVYNFQ